MLFIKCFGSTEARAISSVWGWMKKSEKSSPIRGHLNLALKDAYKLIPGTEEQGERQSKQRKGMNNDKKMQKYIFRGQ